MKVLFLMFVGFDHHTTSEHLLSAIIEQLCINGHSVHIIQKGTGGSLPSIPNKLSRYDITTDVIPFKTVNKKNFIARYLAELHYIGSSIKKITSDYDAIFVQSNIVAGFAVKAIRSKLPEAIVTLNVQDIFPYNAVYSGKIKKNSLAFKILAAIQRYGYNLSNHIITISDDMRDTLINDGIDSDKIEVVYNWSYQDKLYEKLDLTLVSNMFSNKYFNVVYAGNIGVMQNVELLIDAARLMKNEQTVWYHIIGDGVYRDKLEKRAKEYGINNISFWPIQSPELAPIIYSAADVNVIPLVKEVYRTALPSKTATCLACQKPIIFAIGKDSKFGQMAMKEAGCFVIESDNPKELVESINLIRSGWKNDQMGEFFLKYFKITSNSKKYVDIITE